MSEIQKKVYDALIPANENLEVLTKTFVVDGYKVVAQHNPARAVSSGAKLDKATIAKRKCFLCKENRPVDQPSVIYNENFEILKNPFPILKKHLTIPLMRHERQEIQPHFATMLDLSKDLPDFDLLYNGPKCGASAPDHMHFQAGNSDFLTIGEALENAELKTIATDGDAVLAACQSLPLNVFVIDSKDPQAGERLFTRLYDAIPVPEGEKEPMMNFLCFATPAGVRLVVIPRKQHRPSFYGTEGDDKMLLSPASVDMGGVFITPLEKDFNKVDADFI